MALPPLRRVECTGTRFGVEHRRTRRPTATESRGRGLSTDPIFRELPPGIVPLVGTLPSLLTQITQFDIDRFNAALLTVAPGAPATARVDFYDRSGAVIQSITFDAS
jgi:hypothetical protein